MSPEYDAFGRPNRSGSGGGDGEARPSSGGSGGGPSADGGSGSPRPGGGGSWSPSSSGSPGGGGRPRPSDGGAGPRPGSGSGRGCVVALVAVVVVVIAAVALAIVGSGGDDERTANGSTTPFGQGDDDASSMLSPAGTRKAFARLKAKVQPGERVTSLSIRDAYLSAQVTPGPGRSERSITIRENGEDYETTTSIESGARGLSLEAIDVSGPERLLAATRRGLGPRSAATVSYVVLDVPTEPEERSGWAVYLEGTPSDDSRWTSDMRGEGVLRPSDGAPAPPVGDPGPARTPAGTTGTSMVRPANLRRAIDLVGRGLASGSVVTGVDVRPATVTVSIRRSFRVRRHTVDAAFGVEVGSVSETTSKDGIPISQVDARGPERALRKIDARQRNGAPGRVDYVLLNPRMSGFPRSSTVWAVYLKGGHPNGRYWRATLDGRRIGRPGEASAP